MKIKNLAATIAALLMVIVGTAAADRLPASGRQLEAASESAAVADRQASRPITAHIGRSGANAKQLDYATRELNSVFIPEQGVSGKHIYIVQFEEAPLATYRGGIEGLKATSTRGAGQLDAKSAASVAYLGYLSAKQAGYRQKIAAKIGSTEVKFTYQHALNGFAMRMTQQDAMQVAGIPGVKRIERERIHELDTDRGPIFIGAPGVWDGTATGGLEAQGEGLIIGIIDSGVNGASPANGRDVHPSFAEIGGDGYVHTNPLPGFLGECEDDASLCNNKLIGRYSFVDDELTQPGDPQSQDTDGHGSHVMSTAGGNVLLDVPIIDADGEPSAFTFDQVSGVAPHANLIAYKVCAPGCGTSAINAAIDQSIEDGADAINMSISGGPESPWTDSTALAFLNARAAGVFATTSAGNDGPNPSTAAVGKNAPWILSVAALTHDRAFPQKELTDFSGGDTPPPADIMGTGVTGGYTGPIVYAGDFPTGNGSANDTEPEQCLEPFPADTWTDGEIVVCDRGTIARVAKCQNVRDGGAAGCVVANPTPDTLNNDPHVIPAIHIDDVDRVALLTWLASGSDHMATITPTGPVVPDPAAGDIVGDFSSRGPAGFDYLVPNVAAPGIDIFAAGADLMFEHPGFATPELDDDPSVAAAFGIISGTSMAAPHAAGAATLLKQVHPDWTDAEIHSALVSTANPDLLREDGTPADPNDAGGGRIRVDLAAQAGLVLDETQANFLAADPDTGGDPSTLNLALLSSAACLETCDFQRTLKAVAAGTWDISATNAVLSVTPAQFTLAAGETQVIDIAVDVTGSPTDEFTFGRVVLTPQGTGLPEQALPIAISPSAGNIPDTIEIEATADSGSETISVMTLALAEFDAQVIGLDEATQSLLELAEDSDTDPFNNPGDGTSTLFVSVPANALRFVAETFNSESPDLDLFVGVDFNADGMVDVADELVCVSATFSADEICDLGLPGGFPAFDWWIVVQNFAASAAGAIDEFTLATTIVDANNDGNLTVEGPDGPVATGEPYDITLTWDADMEVGDIFYGFVAIGTDPGSPGDLAPQVAIRLERVSSVSFTSTPDTEASVGEAYSAEIAADDAQGEDLSFSAVVLPDWLTLTDNGDGTATLSGTPAADDLGANPVSIEAGDGDETSTQEFVITVADTSPPVITLSGNSTITLTVGQMFDDPGATATDNVDGDLTSEIVTTGEVDTQTPGTYTVSYNVTDAAGNPAATVMRTVTVVAEDDDDDGPFGIGASGAWSLLMLIPLFGAGRRRRTA
ncbi:MAG: S8 family serine peptidase [Gammaproteobacteria bacterium]|nr:S8 family serine peptidase [Gammaproteobacteria bacterium]